MAHHFKHSNIENILQNESFFDVQISAGDKIFSAHKLILASISPLLRNLLLSSSAYEDEKPCVRIALPDVSAESVEKFLSLVYTGHCRIADKNVISEVAKVLDVNCLTLEESLECRCQQRRSLQDDDIIQVQEEEHWNKIAQQSNFA